MEHIQAFLLSQNPDAYLYVAAKHQLGQMGYAATQHLIETMLYGSQEQAWRAIRLLSTCQDAYVISAFIEALDSPDSLIRQAVASTLGQIGDRRTVPALLERLAVETTVVQITIIQALGALKDSRAVGPLLTLLVQTQSECLQQGIINALGEIGDVRAISVLPIFFEAGDQEVCSRAWQVYGQLVRLNNREN